MYFCNAITINPKNENTKYGTSKRLAEERITSFIGRSLNTIPALKKNHAIKKDNSLKTNSMAESLWLQNNGW